jgi:hypothetical protein
MHRGSESALSQLRVQEFLDEVSNQKECKEHLQWYNVDVAAMLVDCTIKGHSINPENGSAVIFLKESVVVCDARKGRVQHYPRGMVHCFIDDNRRKPNKSTDSLFSVELFSISPREEELCYLLNCKHEHEIPDAQHEVSRWLGWLNG